MDINEKIVEEVKKYDCIYNLQSKNYKNFQYKEELWKQIGNDVGVNANDAKKKWKNMRDAYKKQKQKENMPSGSGAIFKKPYKYTDLLRFLDGVQSSRETISNIPKPVVDDITELSSDDSEPSLPPAKKKKSSFDKLQEKMHDVLEAASSSIGCLSASCKDNSTSQLFDTLANKVADSNITVQQKNDIESCVCTLVYSKLSEYMESSY